MKITLVGRHFSPAEHTVFRNGIPDDRMSDYAWLKTGCMMWLKNAPEYDGPAYRGIVELYVEGFTPATVAFLMAWEIYYGGVNEGLHLMHHQPDGTYKRQVWSI